MKQAKEQKTKSKKKPPEKELAQLINSLREDDVNWNKLLTKIIRNGGFI